MLEYDRIDVSERIDVNKTSKSKEYFINLKFKFQPEVCNDCHY